MPLSRITLRLARNPGTEFANGDEHRGYVLTAPLTADGHLDEAVWKTHKADCTVRHFSPDLPEAKTGLLNRRGNNWFFDYDADSSSDDELVFKLGSHAFILGEYVTVTDEDHRPLTYQVREVVAVKEAV